MAGKRKPDEPSGHTISKRLKQPPAVEKLKESFVTTGTSHTAKMKTVSVTDSRTAEKRDHQSEEIKPGTPNVSTEITHRKHSSCMKHTRKDKVKGKNSKMKASISTGSSIPTYAITLPKGPEDYSTNWKKLLKTLPLTDKKGATKSDMAAHFIVSQKNEHTRDKKEVVWFDDVDEILLDIATSNTVADAKQLDASSALVKVDSYDGLTKEVAMDCEMVGIGPGGEDSILARVSLVNHFGACVYDKYVRPTEAVTDYRTHVSGIRRQDLVDAEDYKTVQAEVSDIIKGRILVGHALHNDLQVLFLTHPKSKIRDTLRYKPFRALFNGRYPSLKKLTEKVLNVAVQQGEHNSVQDSQAAMRLYTLHKQTWEKSLSNRFKRSKKVKTKI